MAPPAVPCRAERSKFSEAGRSGSNPSTMNGIPFAASALFRKVATSSSTASTSEMYSAFSSAFATAPGLPPRNASPMDLRIDGPSLVPRLSRLTFPRTASLPPVPSSPRDRVVRRASRHEDRDAVVRKHRGGRASTDDERDDGGNDASEDCASRCGDTFSGLRTEQDVSTELIDLCGDGAMVCSEIRQAEHVCYRRMGLEDIGSLVECGPLNASAEPCWCGFRGLKKWSAVWTDPSLRAPPPVPDPPSDLFTG